MPKDKKGAVVRLNSNKVQSRVADVVIDYVKNKKSQGVGGSGKKGGVRR